MRGLAQEKKFGIAWIHYFSGAGVVERKPSTVQGTLLVLKERQAEELD